MSNLIQSFLEALSSYKQEAFRLETFSSYDIADERESFDLFQTKREVLIDDETANYLREHERKVKEGKRHIRARVIPEPLSDYFIYEVITGYLPQSQIGIELCFMKEREYYDKIESQYGHLKDFWLFDQKTLVQMDYDDDGKFISPKFIDDPLVLSKALSIRNTFVTNSHPLTYLLDNYDVK